MTTLKSASPYVRFAPKVETALHGLSRVVLEESDRAGAKQRYEASWASLVTITIAMRNIAEAVDRLKLDGALDSRLAAHDAFRSLENAIEFMAETCDCARNDLKVAIAKEQTGFASKRQAVLVALQTGGNLK